MDNLTHSVVGLGLGALIDRSLPVEPTSEQQGVRTRLLLIVGCLASNFPDLDLVLTHTLEAPLGYLLMHRGHTHTLVGALGELILLLGLTWLLWPSARTLLRASAQARGSLLATACLGLLLHIGMDAMNVYGVHPFWPFDANWYYGDLVFIVEPVFWIGFGVPLAAMVARKPLRWSLYALLVAVPVGAMLAGFLQWGSLAGLLLLGLALAAIEHHARWRRHGVRPRAALLAGLAASIVFVGVQAAALHQARAIVAASLRQLDAGEHLLDTALSAYPANPLCWSFVTVARADGDHGSGPSLHLRRGLLSILPAVSPVNACPAALGGTVGGTADATAGATVDAAVNATSGPGSSPALAWQSDDREPLATLRSLRQTNCHVDAWLRFARAPALSAGVATDARWGPPGTHNFSSLWYDDLASLPCPRPVPGWGYPRADLLGLR